MWATIIIGAAAGLVLRSLAASRLALWQPRLDIMALMAPVNARWSANAVRTSGRTYCLLLSELNKESSPASRAVLSPTPNKQRSIGAYQGVNFFLTRPLPFMWRNSSRTWTAEQDAQLREGAAKGWSALKIGLRIGRSASAVKGRALTIGAEFKRPTRLPRPERMIPRI